MRGREVLRTFKLFWEFGQVLSVPVDHVNRIWCNECQLQFTIAIVIELMNLASFCRNCLSKWFAAEAEARGIEVDYDEAREMVYGMPYPEWKAKYQKEATAEQLARFSEVNPQP